jgi:cytochrome bd-type quinol oxidase subunit 2
MTVTRDAAKAASFHAWPKREVVRVVTNMLVLSLLKLAGLSSRRVFVAYRAVATVRSKQALQRPSYAGDLARTMG